jgi:hypothetical protein
LAIACVIASSGWRTVVRGGLVEARVCDVVEADDRDVVPHPPAERVQRLQGSPATGHMLDEEAASLAHDQINRWLGSLADLTPRSDCDSGLPAGVSEPASVAEPA